MTPPIRMFVSIALLSVFFGSLLAQQQTPTNVQDGVAVPFLPTSTPPSPLPSPTSTTVSGLAPLTPTPVPPAPLQPGTATQRPPFALPSPQPSGAGAALAITPAPAGAPLDPHFGVDVSNPQFLARSLDVMGVPWYIDYSYGINDLPPGFQKALKVPSNPRAPLADLAATAKARPGMYWVVGNEPNVPGQDDLDPDVSVETLRYYAEAIKAADPTAKLVGPEILNFDFTCTGCAGFRTGRSWLQAFRSTYQQRYGTEPPLDVWSIHTYDLKWDTLPQGDYRLQTDQIAALRAYLDETPALRAAPIWLTEFAVVWGYDSITWFNRGDGAFAQPNGAFRADHLAAYLTDMVNWLRANAAPLHIERWFVFSSHGYKEPWATGPAGVYLVDGLADNARLTDLGQLYRSLAALPR